MFSCEWWETGWKAREGREAGGSEEEKQAGKEEAAETGVSEVVVVRFRETDYPDSKASSSAYVTLGQG